jgi:hypothetical protein
VSDTDADAPADRRPLLAIDGNATPEEVAAVVAVLQGMAAAAASAAAARSERRPRSVWADPSRGVRRPHQAGPGAWRASALPG